MRNKSIRTVHSKYANSNIYCPVNSPAIFINIKQVKVTMKTLLKRPETYTAGSHESHNHASYTSLQRAGIVNPEDSSSNTDKLLF
jgi:hypothetical protein